MPQMTMVQAIQDSLRLALRDDSRVVVMGEDVGRNGGVFRVTEGLQAEFGADRVADTPLAENGIVGAAIGMALYGMRPIVEIQFVDFIYPAFDQIVSELSKMRWRSAGQYACPVLVRAPYGGGIRGGLYHSQSPEAYFCHTPGLKVVIPSTPADAKGLLKSAIRDDDPVIFIEQERMYGMKGEVPEDEDFSIPLGVAEVKREGTDATIVARSLMVPVALKAAEELAKDGVSCEVIDPRTIRPLDINPIVESVKKTNRVVIAEESHPFAGVGAEISAEINERAFDYLDAPVKRVSGVDVPMPYAKNLERLAVPDVAEIIAAVRAISYL